MSIEIYHHPQPLVLESGQKLPTVQMAFTRTGGSATGRVVWICHALTANAQPAEWWPGLLGNGHYFDPEHDTIICANILGSCYGTTGPTSINPNTGRPYGRDFPIITIRDMVQCHQHLANFLQLGQIDVLIGGSTGGQQVLEWAYLEPDRFKRIVPIATNAAHSPWGIAWNEAQRMAIEADPTFGPDVPNGGSAGLKAARAIGILSYRSYAGFQIRQSEDSPDLYDGFKASSYMQHQGHKLALRFDAYSYWTLSKAMDSHNIGRGRGGIAAALVRITTPATVIGLSSDVLFPIQDQELLAQGLAEARYHVIDSEFGHDGFLLEYDQIGQILVQQ
jgi:homoserine O-acetyltransferase/O-succinyltransferase